MWILIEIGGVPMQMVADAVFAGIASSRKGRVMKRWKKV